MEAGGSSDESCRRPNEDPHPRRIDNDLARAYVPARRTFGGGLSEKEAGSTSRPELRRVRDKLPERLNAGILLGDGGFCILGWMLTLAGFHPITIYNSTLFVTDPDPRRSGLAVEVVAGIYGLPAAAVEELARTNDTTPAELRVQTVRRMLDDLLETP